MPQFVDDTIKLIDSMVDNAMGAVAAPPAPATLLHYTSACGLEGILTSKTIYASHFAYLNDPSEMVAFRDICTRLASSKFGPDHTLPDDWADDEASLDDPELVRRVLWRHLTHVVGRLYRVFAPFIASFSTQDDDLSQWRSYAANGRGYCVGVDAGWLQGNLRAARLRPVLYNAHAQEAVVQAAVEELMERLVAWVTTGSGSAASPLSGLKTARMIDTIRPLYALAARLGPMLKHQAYESEHEWRIIAVRYDPGELLRVIPTAGAPEYDIDEIAVRVAGDDFVPYVRIALSDHSSNAFQRLSVGPAKWHKLEQESALRKLLHASGLHSVKVGSSQLPYR